MRNITEIILHCSDSNIKSHDNIATIKEWHLARDFNDVGYHYFITSKGVIERGRDLDRAGAHCKGHNKESIGICLHGKYAGDFNNAQKTTLYRLLRALVTLFPEVTIHGHNEFSNKTCPVFDITPFKTI